MDETLPMSRLTLEWLGLFCFYLRHEYSYRYNNIKYKFIYMKKYLNFLNLKCYINYQTPRTRVFN